ncbi:MAG: PAS domain-containing protein [Zoogloeaceae bacterium]|nr:PAS domain-containing protein [Zoogloeaceae bacterium]
MSKVLQPSPSMPGGMRHPRNLTHGARWVALMLLGCVLVVGLHWSFLLRGHAQQIRDTEAQAQLRAAQLAHAMAVQVEMLVSDIDYMARNVAAVWAEHGHAAVLEASAIIAQSLPDGALTQVAVADAQGIIRFSSLGEGGQPGRLVSIADREHFRVHGEGLPGQLFISEPLVGRLSDAWSVQFTRPVLREGRFDGIVIVSISPEYLSGAFRAILPDPREAVLLVRNDGTYLARSHYFDQISGQRAPATHGFMQQPGEQTGSSKAVSTVDGVLRLYAFHRLERYPLTISLGLDAETALASTRAAIEASRFENAFASALLLIAAMLIGGLFLQREHHAVALAQSRERLELALAGGELGTWDWDVPSGITRFNERWASMLGYHQDDLESNVSTWEKLVHPDDWPQIHAALDPHLRGETPQYESEHRMKHRDGHWVWVLDRGRVVARQPDGSARRVVGTHLDITARKNADARASEASERLARLVAEVPGVVYQYLAKPDGTSSFPYASAGIRSIYGVSAEDAARSADKVFERIHRGDLERVMDSISESEERIAAWRCEYRVVDPDGRVRWLLGQANPQRLEDGSTLWHGYIQDVTDQHLAAEALQESEERLRLTVEAVRDGLWTWDVRTGGVTWDARCYEMLGYADQARPISFELWQEMVHPDDRRKQMAYLQRHFAEHSTQLATQELRVRTAGGEWLWVEVRGRVVAWDGGQPSRMVGTFTDVTNRVAERQLREVLLERSAAVTFIASPDRHMISANARARQVFGRPGEDLSGVDLRRLHVDEEHFRAMAPYYARLFDRGFVRFEYPLRDARGRIRWYDMSGTLRDPERKGSDIVWTLFDVTDRHLAETELKAERLRLTTLLERFPGGVLMEDAANVVVVANQGFCDLFALSGGAGALIGLSHEAVLQRLGPERCHWLHEPHGESGREQRRSVEVEAPGGRVLEIDWLPISSEDERLGRVWMVRDITERKQRESALETLAATDPLTGLPNRRSFMERLDRAWLEARQRPAGDGAVLMLDIDHFKSVNDTWGHAVGDEVLQHVANVIRQSLRRHDVPGRLGGEEFAALLPDATLENARLLAERVRERLEREPARTSAGEVGVTISIGVAHFDGSSVRQVLERADEALYEAKSGGRNRVCLAGGAPQE